jgi:excisionase family DNA binding protein
MSEHPQSPPLAYRIPEAAKTSGTSPTTIYDAISAGDLVPTKVGRRTLIMHDELLRWLRSKQRQPATAEG